MLWLFRHYSLAAALLAVLVFLTACGQTTAMSRIQDEEQPGEASAPDLGQLYMLDRNDVVQVTVFNQEDLTGEYMIGPDGDVSLPLIGDVKAAGLTVRGLSEQIESAYADGYLRNPQVTVQVAQYRPFYIFGEVNEPGDYEYQAGMTVLSAVAIAGGFTEKAIEGSDVMVIRSTDNSRTPVVVGLRAPVYPGDIVEVPSAGVATVPGR